MPNVTFKCGYWSKGTNNLVILSSFRSPVTGNFLTLIDWGGF